MDRLGLTRQTAAPANVGLTRVDHPIRSGVGESPPSERYLQCMVKDSHSADGKNNFTEKIEVAGENLASTVKNLMQDANVRRIIIRNADGRQLMSIPLAVGIAGGALAIFIAPVISAVAVIGGAVAKLKVEVVRTGERRR